MSRVRSMALAAVLLVVAVPGAPRSQQRDEIPITGDAGPGMEALDAGVRAIMRRHGIPGGALAIAKDGRLVFAKGYGWADVAAGISVRPETLFGLASLSKPITAMAILRLIEEGKLDLDSKALDLLSHISPPPGAAIDARLKNVTVRQLLNHSGGWDRAVSGEPISWSPQISRQLRVPQPITPEQFISFMLAVPLDFEPGTQARYSNVGYIMLGQIIEKVSGEKYETHVQKNVFEPMGIRRAGMNTPQQYLPGEARRYLAGEGNALPPLQLQMVKAAGGWSASTVDMVRFLTAVDGSRGKPFLQEKTRKLMLALPPAPIKPRQDGTYSGLGWASVHVTGEGYGYAQDGNTYGQRTVMKRTLKGLNWVLAFNASMQPDLLDAEIGKAALQEVREAVERIKEYPKIDLFKAGGG